MKITSVTTRLISIDPRAFYAQRRAKQQFNLNWEFPLLEIGTDTGIKGYSMGRGTHGEGRGLAHAFQDIYGHRLIGRDPINEPEALWQMFKSDNRHLYSISDAPLGVIDVALWDIRGKSAGLPLATLLGRYRDEIPTYATLGRQVLDTPETVKQSCQQAIEQGYTAAKVQLWGGPKEDIPRLTLARETVGAGYRLMHDVAGAYTLTQALQVGHVLSDLDYYWFEEPVPDAQFALLKHLRNKLKIPILASETAPLSDQHSYLREDACDIMRSDVYITAGITGLRKALAMAALFGHTLEVHTAGVPLLDVAHIHVACTARNTEYVETPPPLFNFGLASNPFALTERGTILCPNQPGLGVELDWDWLNAHTVDTLTRTDAS